MITMPFWTVAILATIAAMATICLAAVFMAFCRPWPEGVKRDFFDYMILTLLMFLTFFVISFALISIG